jgi:hypothetical protein
MFNPVTNTLRRASGDPLMAAAEAALRGGEALLGLQREDG